MKCPARKKTPREKGAGEIALDMCYGGCGGIRLDDGEFTAVYEELKRGNVGSAPWAGAMARAVKFVTSDKGA